jgi:hypothetical protein
MSIKLAIKIYVGPMLIYRALFFFLDTVIIIFARNISGRNMKLVSC